MADKSLTLSPALIAEWEAEHARAAEELQAMNQRVQMLYQRIQAAKLLIATESQVHGTNGAANANGAARQEEFQTEEPSENMTAIIEGLANSRPRPFTHAEMKEELRRRGFPEERLGNYYYTAAHRLKNKGRITISKAGKISGAPS